VPGGKPVQRAPTNVPRIWRRSSPSCERSRAVPNFVRRRYGASANVFSFCMTARTNDLNVAILQHVGNGSEANAVIRNYNMLKSGDKQSLLNYLRSL
jgi:hypothetical protein